MHTREHKWMDGRTWSDGYCKYLRTSMWGNDNRCRIQTLSVFALACPRMQGLSRNWSLTETLPWKPWASRVVLHGVDPENSRIAILLFTRDIAISLRIISSPFNSILTHRHHTLLLHTAQDRGTVPWKLALEGLQRICADEALPKKKHSQPWVRSLTVSFWAFTVCFYCGVIDHCLM